MRESRTYGSVRGVEINVYSTNVKLIMISKNQHKSRHKIGKEAEKLAVNYLRNLYPSASIDACSKGQACDFFIEMNESIRKVEVKSCSNSGRFMIHDYQLEALRNSLNYNNLENLWIFVWFKGTKKLIQLLEFSQLTKVLLEVNLNKCMIGYSKFINMNENEYRENKDLTIKKFTLKTNLNGEKVYKVKFKRYGYLYNISPSRIFKERIN